MKRIKNIFSQKKMAKSLRLPSDNMIRVEDENDKLVTFYSKKFYDFSVKGIIRKSDNKLIVSLHYDEI